MVSITTILLFISSVAPRKLYLLNKYRWQAGSGLQAVMCQPLVYVVFLNLNSSVQVCRFCPIHSLIGYFIIHKDLTHYSYLSTVSPGHLQITT